MPIHQQRTFALADTQVGQVLAIARHSVSLDLRTVSERAGIDFRVLSRIERGSRPCRVTELVTLAETYQIGAVTMMRAITGDDRAMAKVSKPRNLKAST
jgi:transcriptional regulator with XRE-family HTH domain